MVGRLFSRKSFVPRRLPSPARSRIRPRLEELEARTLLSASAADPVITPLIDTTATPQLGSNTTPAGFSPSQIQTAYGYNLLPSGTNGSGQTIAIVDAYNDPNIVQDVQTFNNQFGLGGTSFLTVIDQNGNIINPKSTSITSNSSWGGEISLDVEWAHAMAPGANIVLAEANSSSTSDLMTAVNAASNYSGVSVVSMSWGGREFSGETSSANDGVFASHPNITYVASSGDSGAPPIWPAVSPYVVAVGGTNLYLTPSGTYGSETGWGDGRWSFFFGGSGGGISTYESQPSYQSGVDPSASTTKRLSPDVSYDASPSTGFAVYDSFGYSGWLVVGGTSAGAPQWSAIFATVNQERAAANGGNSNPIGSNALSALYNLYKTSYSTDFHDVTSGNNGYKAGTGYDLVTGVGTPQVANLVPGLAHYVGTHSGTLVKTGTSNTGSNTLLGHHDMLAQPTTGDVSAPNVGNGTSTTTIANSGIQTAVSFVTSNTAVSGSTNATPFPIASAVFGQTTGLATPLTIATSGTTGALASFTPFTGLFGAPRSDTAHGTGGYNDSTLTATNDNVPTAPAIPDPDFIEVTPVPVPPAGVMGDTQSLLQAPAGCDACFANEEAMLALGGDSEDNAVVEDQAVVVRSAGAALIGLGAILSGFWIERPGTTEEARRRAAVLLLSGK